MRVVMQRYLVGGAVRDQLLGLPVRERDWVVVGADAKTLLAEGFLQVGRNFPVFLHPITREEHALARTERKVGRGHCGFECQTTPHVTLEQDLLRRDLTINAMAQAEDGTVIDPCQGQRDLQQRWLRHVSPAFAEDPLRVLRVARFFACYASLGFRIAPETVALMRTMATSGELQQLAAERVWQETEKALHSAAPQCYFMALRECQALPLWFPELANLFGIPAPAKWHPEIDSGVHTLMAIEQAAQLSEDIAVRFAVLCHDFGKASTPKACWPHHPHHGSAGLALINAFCNRLRVPNVLRELALLVAKVHSSIHRVHSLTAEQLLTLLDNLDVWRRPERLSSVLLACTADARGRQGLHSVPYSQAEYLQRIFTQLLLVKMPKGAGEELLGAAVGKALRQRRLQRLQQLL